MKLCNFSPLATLFSLAAAGVALAAPGDPSPLAQVPASAALVIHVNGPDVLGAHVAAFLKNAVPEQGAVTKANLEAMFRGEGFGGRKVVGLVRDGHIFLVMMDARFGSFGVLPGLAVVVPVTRYAEFRDGFLKPEERKSLKFEAGYESAELGGGLPLFFVDHKGYAVIVETKEVAELFVKGFSGLDGKLSKDQADRLLKSDLGAYADADAYKKEYPDAFKDAHKGVDDALNQMETSATRLQKAQLEMAKVAVAGAFQAVADCPAGLATGELGPNGASLHAEVVLKSGSLTAAAMKDSKPSAFRDLARTPAGQIVYAAYQTGPLLSQLLGPVQFGAVIDPDSESAKAAGEAVDQLIEAKPASRLQAWTAPPAGVETWEYEDPQKAVAAETKLLEALRPGDSYLYGVLRDKPEIKTKVVRYRGFDMTYAHLTFDVERMLADAPEPPRRSLVVAVKKLLGDGVSFWYGSDGKVLIQATARDWFAARKQLDQYFASEGAVAKDEAFADVRKELPPETSALLMIDAVQFAGQALEFFRPVIEAQGSGPMKLPPPLKGKPAFVGASLTLRPERIDADVYVTADAVRQIVKGLPGMFPFY